MAPERTRRRIPDATVARLPVYLRILTEQGDEGVDSISSERLAELGGVNAAKVRKDLSYLGSYGTRGVGYEVAYLVYQIRRELGLTHDWPVVIVGAGNLGQALAGYGGFGERGFPVAGIVDIDDSKVGSVLSGVRVRHLDELPQIVQTKRVSIGVVATPASAAQDAADRLVRAGVTSILNFAPWCSRFRGRSRFARWTSLSSCRSSATTNSAAPAVPSTRSATANDRRARR
jgi:redox-sensing transcriptional repressor